ncbi:MAG: hypothetical protein FWC50_00965 [Planctomycetaceae bacterium]|nr:hypothetical protein [Planctomycetaceae bacterium]
MITSSLPPEWKVSIASVVLLAGGLLALRFPAEHDVMHDHVARTQPMHRTPTVQESARQPSDAVSSSYDHASRDHASTQYMTADDFAESGESEDSLRSGTVSPSSSSPSSSSAKPDRFAVLTDSPTEPANLSNLPPSDYRTMSYHDQSVPTDSGLKNKLPEYKPFESALPMSKPEPNPAFASAASAPPPILFSVIPVSVIPESASLQSPMLQAPGSTTESAVLPNHGAPKEIRVLPARNIGYVARRNDFLEPENRSDKVDNPFPRRNVISARGNAVILPDRSHGKSGR